MANNSSFFKNNSQLVYSLILIIMIPVLIIANTLWQMKTSRENMDYELQQKALLAENILSSSISSSLDNTNQELQKDIDQISKDNEEINEVTVLQQITDGFLVIASSNQQILGTKYTSTDYVTAWTQDNPTAMLVNDTSKTPNVRLWSVTSPLLDTDGSKAALINMKVSLSDIDTLTQKNLTYSLVFLVITVFFVLLLLVNHFRFFEYSILFKQLKEVDKMKDDFISIASHELKTPMAAIKGYISMMNEGIAGKMDNKAKEHLIKIDNNVKRLDTLVSETLDVSRLEQGRMQFDMQPVNISEVMAKSITAFKDRADEKKLYLKEEKPEKLPQVFADPDRLQQVTDNLVGNAIKYTQKGGVTISYRVEENNLMMMVKDTGIGMNAIDRKQLFNKFYRIRNEKTADISGTGLGLWISREIVRKMNGDILVDSMENSGSQFTVTLPFIKEK